MKPVVSILAAIAFAAPALASAQAVVGQAAPAFTVTDASGKKVSLADYKGKYVVLEWVNPSCPYVKKHYDSGNMQATQKFAAGKGVTWLSVSTTGSDAAAKSGPELTSWAAGKNAAPSAILLDAGAKIGKAYGAKTTPHMYIIDPAGKLVYAGAIDSKPSAKKDDIQGATNYVVQGLSEVLAGKAITTPVSQPYGCSVKYDS
jgi:peroxiredoxin